MKNVGRARKPRDILPFLAPLSERLREVIATGLKVDFPPAGFDPVTASDEELRRHALPPRPNRTLTPKAYSLWNRAMTGPLIWPSQDLLIEDIFLETTLRTHPQLSGSAHVTAEAASQNWSGAFVRPGGFGNMTRVQGVWTVPDTAIPAGVPETYASSAWVGLDGHDTASRSLPQIGTGQWISQLGNANPVQAFFAWWQWFARDSSTNGQILLRGFPISKGDTIYGSVEMIGATTAAFFIRNFNTNQAFPFWFDASAIKLNQSATNPIPISIEGRTAEWILERPAHRDDPALYLLPRYSNTSFDTCLAGTDHPGPQSEIDLARAHLVRMIEKTGDGSQPEKVVSSVNSVGSSGLSFHCEL